MKDPNSDSQDSGSPDQKDESSPINDSQETGPSSQEEEATEYNTEAGFEEQEAAVLPPEEKKKSGAGKFFLFLVLVLAGSGGYLYFNNLIPSEILNLIFPKPAPSTSPALVAKIPPTPLPIEEDVVEPEVVENRNTESIAIQESPTVHDTPETHISGIPTESLPPTRISGNNFDQIPETKPAEEPEKFSQDTASVAESEAIVLPIEEPPEPVAPSAPLVECNESVQAYLDFIESSVQKLGEFIKEGFNLSRNYLKEKLG